MALCEKIKEKISLYIENELEETEKAELEKHLKSCEQCQKYYEEMKTLLGELKEIDEIEVPKELHESIMNSVKELKNNKATNKAKLYQVLPTAACFLVMCVVTFALTDMQNKKAIQQQQGSTEGLSATELARGIDEPSLAQEPNLANAEGGQIAITQGNEQKAEPIIKESIELSFEADNNKERFNEAYKLALFYDPEAILNENEIEFKILKDEDYDVFVQKMAEIGSIKELNRTQEDRSEEYKEIFKQLEATNEKDPNAVNALREKAFLMEFDLDFYYVKVKLQ